MHKFFKAILLTAAVLFMGSATAADKGNVTLVTAKDAHERVKFGTERLAIYLERNGYEVKFSDKASFGAGKTIVIGETNTPMMSSVEKKLNIVMPRNVGKEGFFVKGNGERYIVGGDDPSGVLYGCIELVNSLKETKQLPAEIDMTDKPEMVLRGTCIGVQKTEYLPGRTVYEYPYTPESFPWFYDKEHWIKYLDMLVENRMNSVYLWNGHPFASLVKLKDYPFAVEVDDATFEKNKEVFSFLTTEADKRGIAVIQKFYNILVSKPFAEHYGIKTQERSRQITPVLSDYTRKSIAAFVENYPNVGLLVCLGEAMDTYDDDVNWFVNTIIPGVKDGLKALGRTDEPPILLRAHDTNCKMVMDEATKHYSNLYTMHKYNGESLTTYEPRGPWSKIHTDLSALGSIHIENVHVLANLEPFRWGSPEFIQKTVQAMHSVHGANGLHLFPQASYWEWPYTADKTADGTRLMAIDRDWIWYQNWARYAWKADRDTKGEADYWTARLAEQYGCDEAAARSIKNAYDQMGEIAPKLLRKFGITEGNRQTLLLGMFMSQLVNPAKWRVYEGFHSSCGPIGERLQEYMNKEWNKVPHIGEVPPQLTAECLEHGRKAVAEIEKAAPSIKTNREEFERLRNDMHCYDAFAKYFDEKVKAAMLVLNYSYSKNISDLDKAAEHLEKSLAHYRHLVDLTKDTYLYANSMQTAQRRIPIGGNDGKNKTWVELLPHYEAELATFRKNIAFVKTTSSASDRAVKPLTVADVVFDGDVATLAMADGAKLFEDRPNVTVGEFATEISKLRPVVTHFEKQRAEGTSLTFTTKEPVNVLVGYFGSERDEYLRAPILETDATANDYGQAETKITNAIEITGLPPVNIHSYSFPAGKNTLNLGKGGVMVLGIAKAEPIAQRDAAIAVESDNENVDWLFY